MTGPSLGVGGIAEALWQARRERTTVRLEERDWRGLDRDGAAAVAGVAGSSTSVASRRSPSSSSSEPTGHDRFHYSVAMVPQYEERE